MKKSVALILFIVYSFYAAQAQETSKYDHAVLITANGNDAKWMIYYSSGTSDDLGKVEVTSTDEYYKKLFEFFDKLNTKGYELESSLACANCSKSFYFKKVKKK